MPNIFTFWCRRPTAAALSLENQGEDQDRDKIAALLDDGRRGWVMGVSVYFDKLFDPGPFQCITSNCRDQVITKDSALPEKSVPTDLDLEHGHREHRLAITDLPRQTRLNRLLENRVKVLHL